MKLSKLNRMVVEAALEAQQLYAEAAVLSCSGSPRLRGYGNLLRRVADNIAERGNMLLSLGDWCRQGRF